MKLPGKDGRHCEGKEGVVILPTLEHEADYANIIRESATRERYDCSESIAVTDLDAGHWGIVA